MDDGIIINCVHTDVQFEMYAQLQIIRGKFRIRILLQRYSIDKRAAIDAIYSWSLRRISWLNIIHALISFGSIYI